MDEFSELYGDEFFIIDSNNLNSVESKLYGFSICDDEIIIDEELDETSNLSGLGTYIHISRFDDEISICQDSNGDWGLYIFKKDDYFAISNSFLKLVEYLRDDFQINLNNDYAKSLILTNSYSIIFKKTLINEIEAIPRNYILHIDILTKSITFEKLDFKMNTVPINTDKSLEILDNWFYKWIAILRKLKGKTNNIQINLSEDIQSIIILMFALCANIDFNKIKFVNSISNEGSSNTIINFFEKFGLKWDNNVISSKKEFFHDLTTSLNLIFYSKLGISNKFYCNSFRYDSPIYNFGSDGEFSTDTFYQYETINDIVEYFLNTAGNWDDSLKIPFNRIFKDSLITFHNEFSKYCNNHDDLFKLYYSEVIFRNYFGKQSLMNYLGNSLNLNPLSDNELLQLNLDIDDSNYENLLITLMLMRYCPVMLNDFVNNYDVDVVTLKYAKIINNSRPFYFKEYEFVSGPPINNLNDNLVDDNNRSEITQYLEEIFKSDNFEDEFIKYFSSRLYNKIYHLLFSGEDFSFERSNASFSVLKVIDDVNSFGNYSGSYGGYWLEKFNINNTKKTTFNNFNFNKDLIKFIQDAIIKNDFFKYLNFDITVDKIKDNDLIEFKNIMVYDFQNNIVDIDYDNLFLEVNNSLVFPFNKLIQDSINNSYFLEASEIGVGIHEVCIRYKYNYSDNHKIFIKDYNNLLDFNIWSGTESDDIINGFNTGIGQLINSSDDWAFFGSKSFKLLKVNDNGVWTDLLLNDVFAGDTVHVSFSLYNPNCKVNVFFVFTDKNNNQSFSNALLNLKSDEVKNISIDGSLGEDIMSVGLRFCIIGDIGSNCYIDNINVFKI